MIPAIYDGLVTSTSDDDYDTSDTLRRLDGHASYDRICIGGSSSCQDHKVVGGHCAPRASLPSNMLPTVAGVEERLADH